MGMTVMVMDREKIISLLKEMSDYFRECRTNASLGSKAENHFWELQIAAQDAATLLKMHEEVVRCISCTFYRSSDGQCELHEGRWKPEGYCSWAIRKKGR